MAVLGTLVLLVTACGNQRSLESGAPSPQAMRVQRIKLLEAQLAEGKKSGPRWRAWCDAFLRQKPRGGNESILCDEGLVEKLSNPRPRTQLRDNPGPLNAIVDFQDQLRAHGIDLLVVFIPPAAAVFPEEVLPDPPLPEGKIPLLDWRFRRFFLALEHEGVEVLDLLPAFVDKRFGGSRSIEGKIHQERIFVKGSVYWRSYGARVAAEAVGERIKKYPWFPDVKRQMGRAVLVERTGWSETKRQVLYRVHIAGEPTDLATDKDLSFDRESPILLIGDSFSRKHSDVQAGFTDQLLRELGFRVDIIAVDSGSARGSRKALALRADGLRGKRLVVYLIPMMSLRENQHAAWTLIDVFGDARSRVTDGDG
ncbi:MAG: hypothetical protein ACE5E4_08120 [Candidatus Binatia bacterium]